MATNVRCTNVNVWRDGAFHICGWTGYRKPHPGYGVPTKTLPCPRCGGGGVEPISAKG